MAKETPTASPSPAPESEPPTAGSESEGVTPFALTLGVATGPVFKGIARNQSNHPQWLLRHASQPFRLELIGPEGQVIEPFDYRSRRGYDPTVRRSDFRKLPPGSIAVVGNGDSRRTRNGFQIRWPPYEYRKLPPGNYTAQLVWYSRIDDYATSDGMKKPGRVWKGLLRSPPVNFVLSR